jgi:phage baseplate assembly protein V
VIPPFITNLFGKGRITRTDDSGDMQKLQVTEPVRGAGQDPFITKDVQRLAEYGFATVVPADTDVLLVRLGGMRSHTLAIATSHRDSRPTGLSEGDVVIYDTRGHRFSLTENGLIIDAAGDEVTVVNASKVRCECDIETTGDVISRADGTRVSLNKLHDAYNMHDHPPVTKGDSWGSGQPSQKA